MSEVGFEPTRPFQATGLSTRPVYQISALGRMQRVGVEPTDGLSSRRCLKPGSYPVRLPLRSKC